MAVTPVLQKPDAFDVTVGTTLYFDVSGSTDFIRSSIAYFIDPITSDVIASHAESTTQLYNIIPANLSGLQNGKQYNVYIEVYTQVNPSGETPVGTSVAKSVYCLPTPDLTITDPSGDPTSTTNIEVSSYEFKALFTMYDDASYLELTTNKVQEYTFNLYNGIHDESNLVGTSGLIRGTGEPVSGSDLEFILSYNFNGLVNNNSYYIELTIVTEQGMRIVKQSPYIVPRLGDITFSVAQVKNNSCDGYIEVQSNITNITGYTNSDFEVGSGEIDLTTAGEYVMWGYNPNTQEEDHALTFPNINWSMILAAYDLTPSTSSPMVPGDMSYILKLSNYENTISSYIYVRQSDNDKWLELYVIDGNTVDADVTFVQSNVLTNLTDSTPVYILLRNIGGQYDIIWSTSLPN